MMKGSRDRSGMSLATGGEARSPWPEVEPSTLVTLRVNDSEGVRITRTMRTTDKLRDLIGLYFAMALADVAITLSGAGVFMHYGRRVTGDKTPADYDMEDGDEVSFFPDGTRTMPVTLTVKDRKGRRITRTMHRFNNLNILFKLYYEMLPSGAPKEGFFVYHGREVNCFMTPDRCDMKDGDEIAFVAISKPSKFVTLTMKRNNNDGRCSVTRTMRRTDKLQDLIDFYYDMVPTDEHGEWDVVYCSRQVDGEKTPADYEMEDGDHLRLVPVSKRSKFVTVMLVLENVRRAHTLRRTDELQDLMDLCSRTAPASKYRHGCAFLYVGRRVHGSQTPDDLELEDGDMIDVLDRQFG